jgi:hypothetical protein
MGHAIEMSRSKFNCIRRRAHEGICHGCVCGHRGLDHPPCRFVVKRQGNPNNLTQHGKLTVDLPRFRMLANSSDIYPAGLILLILFLRDYNVKLA